MHCRSFPKQGICLPQNGNFTPPFGGGGSVCPPHPMWPRLTRLVEPTKLCTNFSLRDFHAARRPEEETFLGYFHAVYDLLCWPPHVHTSPVANTLVYSHAERPPNATHSVQYLFFSRHCADYPNSGATATLQATTYMKQRVRTQEVPRAGHRWLNTTGRTIASWSRCVKKLSPRHMSRSKTLLLLLLCQLKAQAGGSEFRCLCAWMLPPDHPNVHSIQREAGEAD